MSRPVHIEPTEDLIRCPVAEWAEWRGDLPAFILPHREVSFEELDFSIRLQRRQLEDYSGQAIGLQEWNSPELVHTLFAAWRLRCLTLLLNPRLPQNRAEEIVASVEADLISSARGRDGTQPAEPTFLRENDILRPVEPSFLDPAAAATGMLTSGTTGNPRLIIHSIGNHVASAQSCASRLELGPGSDWLWSLSSFHVGGLAILWRCFLNGAAVRFMPRERSLAEQIQVAPPTIMSVVPTQLGDLVAAGVPCPTRIKDVIVGGAPTSKALLEAALDLGYPVRTTYGMTETSSMVTLSERWEKGSVLHAGRPLEGVDIELDEQGRITVSAPSVRIGEHVDGSFIPYDAGAGYQTQDRGAFTPDGELQILSRMDDVVITGGENVSLTAIEEAILRLPGVVSCRVVAIAHPRYGERPVAFVTLKNRAELSVEVIDALKSGLAGTLPSFAVPERVLPLPDLVEGALKITRDQLVAIATQAG